MNRLKDSMDNLGKEVGSFVDRNVAEIQNSRKEVQQKMVEYMPRAIEEGD